MKYNKIVYVGFIKGQVIYVGYGTSGREKHLNNGISHVYNANKYHFNGGWVDVQIVKEGLNKEQALELEELLIDELKPVWNENKGGQAFSESSKIKAEIKRNRKNLKLHKMEGKLIQIYADKANHEGVVYINPKEFESYHSESLSGLCKRFNYQKSNNVKKPSIENMFGILDSIECLGKDLTDPSGRKVCYKLVYSQNFVDNYISYISRNSEFKKRTR